MSVEVMTASIEKLLMLHRSLYQLAVKKTEIIKKSDMEALDQLLKEEQKHIAAIGQVEKERQKAVMVFSPDVRQPTMSDCIKSFSELEQDRLTVLVNELALYIQYLKDQNNLNQQLIHHSLQFANFSMELLRPQPANINYSPPTKNQKPSETHSSSIINSEA